MKKLFLTSFAFILAILMFQSCKSSGKSADDNQVMNFKTIVVEYNSAYEMMGIKMTEKETTWMDIKNKKEASVSVKNTSMMGVETSEETMTLKDGDWYYTINLKEKTGTKTNIKEMQDVALMFAGSVDVTSLKDFVEKNGGKVLDNESFLGKDCLVYELMGTKNWMYKGIILKTMMGDKIMKEAVKIDEDVKIPSDKFELPSGIKITEMEDILNSQK
jgi:hypothetical protein